MFNLQQVQLCMWQLFPVTIVQRHGQPGKPGIFLKPNSCWFLQNCMQLHLCGRIPALPQPIIIRVIKITQVRVQMVVKLPREGPQGYRGIIGAVSPPPINSFIRTEQVGDTDVQLR